MGDYGCTNQFQCVCCRICCIACNKRNRTAFVIFGVLAVIVGIVTFFWAKNEPADVNCLPDNMELDETVSTQEVVVDNEKYSIRNILKNKNTWLIVFGYGFLWMVLVGIISQFVPRMMSVGYTNAEALTFMSITSIICNSGKLSLGMARFQIRNKEHFHCICIFLCGCTGIADHIL